MNAIYADKEEHVVLDKTLGEALSHNMLRRKTRLDEFLPRSRDCLSMHILLI